MTHVENSSDIVEEQAGTLPNEIPENAHEELSEDMEVMGPGQILSDARKIMGLSQQDVANKLNFRKSLVDAIENEIFDPSLPETFNRGYLRNYAKLVKVSQADVMLSYEQLNVAKTQASELQSFSKGTEKLAESNRIMWVSYLILAILIGSTVVWWMQNNAEQAEIVTEVNLQQTDRQEMNSVKNIEKPFSESSPEVVAESQGNKDNTLAENNTVAAVTSSLPLDPERSDKDATTLQVSAASTVENSSRNDVTKIEKEVVLTDVTFTFSGDCWVNISDATGERIAWGVKRLGYVMKISGQAPFNVTLGKPELVSINFAGKAIDMNQFNAGNIAKFTLPVAN